MSNGHVMVVDDDRDIRESLAEVLQDEGYSVTGAGNGREALDALEAGSRPRVILLDLMMPVMDGYQFYEHWRARPELKSIPLFIVTAGRASREALPEATHLLPKPLDLDRLLEMLSAAMK